MISLRSIYDVDGALVGFVQPHGTGWRALDPDGRRLGTFATMLDAVRGVHSAHLNPDRSDARLLAELERKWRGEGGAT